MQFLRTAFWVILAMIIMLFTFTNWTPVTINIWGGNMLETKLPLVVIVAFLAGSLPFWMLHKTTRWRMNRKLVNAERALAATVPPPPPPIAPLPVNTSPNSAAGGQIPANASGSSFSQSPATPPATPPESDLRPL